MPQGLARALLHHGVRLFNQNCRIGIYLHRTAAAVIALWCAGTQLLCAAAVTPFAAPEQLTASHPATGALRVVIALLIVLGAVVVAGRFANRMRSLGAGSSQGMQVLGQLPLGPRERAVLIRVGERSLLLGVAAGNVRTLHVFDQLPLPSVDAVAAGGNAPRPTFKSILLKSLGK